MKYLSQFLIILSFTLAGEALQRLIPLPIPASVYGLVLLFVALCVKLVKVDRVKETGSFLISLLPFLFVSHVVGIVEHWGAIRSQILPICLLIVSTTVLVFGISGSLAQLLRKGGKKHG